jgi:hypothetical protein
LSLPWPDWTEAQWRKFLDDEDDAPRVDLDSAASIKAWDTRGRATRATVRRQERRKDYTARQARAVASHKPATKEKQDLADKSEQELRAMVGGDRTGDNSPYDVTLKIGDALHVFEVKTFTDNENDKVTVHKGSRLRKEKWAREHDATIHTVMFDRRDEFGAPGYSGHKIYYKPGIGSFHRTTMTPANGKAHLLRLIGQEKSLSVDIDALGALDSAEVKRAVEQRIFPEILKILRRKKGPE